MARRFTTVIIDDKYELTKAMTATFQEYASIHPVTGVDDVIEELDEIESSHNQVVDIILCDVNMETDPSPQPFLLDTERSKGMLTPNFSLRQDGSSARDPVDAASGGVSPLLPYGPILALPFTRYFRSGGVIQPISNYWHDKRLVDGKDGHINGYVYVCLRLIMEQGGGVNDDSGQDFGARFSAMYGAAIEATDATLYEEQFGLAVTQRRHQLLSRAHAIEGLEHVTLETIREQGEVAIWSADGRVDRIQRSSMFADYAIQLAKLERQASERRLPKALAMLREGLESELARYTSGLDVDAICNFCSAFVDVMDGMDGGKFIQRYAKARMASGTSDPTVPPPCEPLALKTHLRRYLLLTAELYIYQSRVLIPSETKANSLSEGAMNRALCEALGLPWTDQKAKEFAYGVRNLNTARKRFAGDRFARPFWTGNDSTGWQAFNLLRRPTGADGYWDWDAIDRRVAQAVWKTIGEERETLPHGLGED